jgi:hypothetical protein
VSPCTPVNLEFSVPVSGGGYPSGIIICSGAGMGAFFYPRTGTDNPMSKISSGGCGYGFLLPIGYVSIAIFT